MIDQRGEEYGIYFRGRWSEMYYKISTDKKVESFGQDAQDYQNFCGKSRDTSFRF